MPFDFGSPPWYIEKNQEEKRPNIHLVYLTTTPWVNQHLHWHHGKHPKVLLTTSKHHK